MSPPKKKIRNCSCPLRGKVGHAFNPSGKALHELEIVSLERDELEVLYLCDSHDFNQKRAGEMMGVSRGTVQRLLAVARKKMIEVLVGQKALVIVGEVPLVQKYCPTIISQESDQPVQEFSSCGSGDFGPCQGPRSCPWRKQDSGACSQARMGTA